MGRWCSNAYVARQCNATTLATLAPNSALGTGYGSTTIAGAIITYSNGMVEQVWNLDMAAWITNALVFAHLTVDWGFHSMIPGMRRVLLSTQVRRGALGGTLKGIHAAALQLCTHVRSVVRTYCACMGWIVQTHVLVEWLVTGRLHASGGQEGRHPAALPQWPVVYVPGICTALPCLELVL